MSSPTQAITTETVAEALASVLRRRWSSFRSPTKQIAASVGADPRAAKNWWEARNPPHLAQAIELMAADPQVEEAILDLVRARRAERGDPSVFHRP